jgi:diguanylate cyclase (GGDEF)-like protein
MSEKSASRQFRNIDLAAVKEEVKAIDSLDKIVLPRAVQIGREVAEQIHNDDLTNLLNKKTWRKKLDEALQQKGDKAVLFIDLTNFKRINDEDPGKHEAGDVVLRKVASVLRESFRLSDNDMMAHERHYEPTNEVGRIGGDEFAVLLDLTPRQEEWENKEPSERMRAVIHRLNDQFEQLKTENPLLAQYGFDVAIGGAVWEPGMDAATLLTQADHAMSVAKAEQHESNGRYR